MARHPVRRRPADRRLAEPASPRRRRGGAPGRGRPCGRAARCSCPSPIGSATRGATSPSRASSPAAPGPRGRVARPAAGHEAARGVRGDHPPGERRARTPRPPHRRRGAEFELDAFAALRRLDEIFCANFIGLPRLVEQAPLRRLVAERGVEGRPLPARELGARTGLRLADGLRRDAAGARTTTSARPSWSPTRTPRWSSTSRRHPRVRDRSIFVGGPRATSWRDGSARACPLDPRLDEEHFRLGLRHRLRAGQDRRSRRAPARARVRPRGAGVRGRRGRLGDRPRADAGGPSRRSRRRSGGAGAADDRRLRARASTRARCRPRTGWRPRLRPPALPQLAACDLAICHGGPLDHDGADRGQHAVPVLPAQAALRAEPPRRPPARAPRRRAAHELQRRRAERAGRGDRRGARARAAPPADPPGGATRAARIIGELL